MKKDFDVDKLIKYIDIGTSILLNDIAQTIKEDWDFRIKISVPPRLEESTKSLHGSHIPLNLTGKLLKSNKVIPATPTKLKAVVQNTAKSSKSYKIRGANGKVYKGTRKSAPVFYGYYQNKGFTTASNSLIPNKTVPARDFTSVTTEELARDPKYKVAMDKYMKNLELSWKIMSSIK